MGFLAEKEQEYQLLLQKEVAKVQSEYQKQHSNLTQEIYEDVNKTLKEENKRRQAVNRQQLEEEYSQKLNKMENHFNGLLAKERLSKGKVEMKVL